MRMVPHTKPATPAARLWLMAILASVGGIVLSAGSTPVRLLGVSSQGSAVLIEASEPVAYSVHRPDPLTVVVEMRNVSATMVANSVERRDPIAAVTVEDGTAIDGKAVARVRIALARLSEHKVRSARGTIRLELTPLVDPPATAAADLPMPVAATGNRAPTAAAPTVATALNSVRTSLAGGRTVITLQGNGRLTPSNVSETADGPRRVVLDFADVTPRAAARTLVDSSLVTAVRVTLNSRTPLLTRVVMDVTEGATYFVERAGQDGSDLSVVFEAPAAAATLKLVEPDGIVIPAGPVTPVTAANRLEAAPMALAETPDSTTALATAAGRGPQTPQARAQGPAPGSTMMSPQQEPGGRRYTGPPISLDFSGIDLRAVLRVFAEHSGLNIIIDPAVPSTPVDL
ncbi:MAG: AMIN domain-containing protein, partial [Acidobacteria bacterium]|nr:AMIN domain-containing protein [Acidobacteriota bacterium]